jgi:hypothetical protein
MKNDVATVMKVLETLSNFAGKGMPFPHQW